jgi:hypothetical protein
VTPSLTAPGPQSALGGCTAGHVGIATARVLAADSLRPMPAPRTGSSSVSAAERLASRREREDALVEAALSAIASRNDAREAFQAAENTALSAIVDVFELGYKDGDIADILDIPLKDVKAARKAPRTTPPAPPAATKPAAPDEATNDDADVPENSAD